jgi:hypothetical protein
MARFSAALRLLRRDWTVSIAEVPRPACRACRHFLNDAGLYACSHAPAFHSICALTDAGSHPQENFDVPL